MIAQLRVLIFFIYRYPKLYKTKTNVIKIHLYSPSHFLASFLSLSLFLCLSIVLSLYLCVYVSLFLSLYHYDLSSLPGLWGSISRFCISLLTLNRLKRNRPTAMMISRKTTMTMTAVTQEARPEPELVDGNGAGGRIEVLTLRTGQIKYLYFFKNNEVIKLSKLISLL